MKTTEPEEDATIADQVQQWVKEGRLPENMSAQEFEAMLKKLMHRRRDTEDWSSLFQKQAGKVEDIKKNAALHKFLLDNRETLLQLLQPDRARKSRKFRQSGHFVDQSRQIPLLLYLISSARRRKIKSRAIMWRSALRESA
jgi:hypothetical protein